MTHGQRIGNHAPGPGSPGRFRHGILRGPASRTWPNFNRSVETSLKGELGSPDMEESRIIGASELDAPIYIRPRQSPPRAAQDKEMTYRVRPEKVWVSTEKTRTGIQLGRDGKKFTTSPTWGGPFGVSISNWKRRHLVQTFFLPNSDAPAPAHDAGKDDVFI